MLIIIFSDQVCYTLLEMNCDFVLTIHQRDFNPARAKQVKVGLPPNWVLRSVCIKCQKHLLSSAALIIMSCLMARSTSPLYLAGNRCEDVTCSITSFFLINFLIFLDAYFGPLSDRVFET